MQALTTLRTGWLTGPRRPKDLPAAPDASIAPGCVPCAAVENLDESIAITDTDDCIIIGNKRLRVDPGRPRSQNAASR